MSNSNIQKIEHLDFMLGVTTLKKCGEKYAKGDDQKQYLISPIYGSFENIPPTLVFYGTHEILYPDCEKLKQITAKVNKNFIFRKYKGMQHDWPLFPIPEGRKVMEEIGAFITE